MSDNTVGHVEFGTYEPCTRCGQYHVSTVCPHLGNPTFTTYTQWPPARNDEEIIKRLDRIIELLEGVQPMQWRGGPR